MRIILAGTLETALVRAVNEAQDPARNRTTHGYYMGLYRRVPRAHFARAATFVALALETQIPSIDWAMPEQPDAEGGLSAPSLGVVINDPAQYGGREWDDDASAFADLVLASDALSPLQRARIGDFSLDDVDPPWREETRGRAGELHASLARHYLCRLFLHVRAAPAAGALLVMTEDDVRLLGEIAGWLARHRLPTPFDFPDVAAGMVEADAFAAGLINFDPPDATSLMAVRTNRAVVRYAARIRPLLARTDEEAQRALIRAMADSDAQAAAGHRAQTIFEIVGWALKPVQWVPWLGTAAGIFADFKDAMALWAKRRTAACEWYLIGVRMQDIALKDYLARKGNLMR